MAEYFSHRISPERQELHRRLDVDEARLKEREAVLRRARIRMRELSSQAPQCVYQAPQEDSVDDLLMELESDQGIRTQPRSRLVEAEAYKADTYSSDSAEMDRSQPKHDRYEGLGYGKDAGRRSFDALVDELDSLERKAAMRDLPRQEGVRNPGHSRRDPERDWQRSSAAELIDRGHWADTQRASESYQQKFADLEKDFHKQRTSAQPISYDAFRQDKSRIRDEYWANMEALDAKYKADREQRGGLNDADYSYYSARKNASTRSRYPAQKPEYKDKLGRPTPRDWNEGLMKAEMTDDEALEIELELRNMHEAEIQEKQTEREEHQRVERRLANERALEKLQDELEAMDHAPMREAALKYGSTTYDSDSVTEARRRARDIHQQKRRDIEIRGNHPAQKPFDPRDINRALKERRFDQGLE